MKHPFRIWWATIRVAVVSLACVWTTTSRAQQSTKSFFDVRREYYAAHPDAVNPRADEEDADDAYTRFNRWSWFMEPRVGPTGAFFRPDALLQALNTYDARHARKFNEPTITATSAKWRPLGPMSFPNTANNGGTGRISCVRIDPSNPSTIYCGTPEGGLWKHTTSGWSALTDHLPNLGVTDVAIDPHSSSVLYIATGDGDAAGMYGNPYSYGIMKSTDGGATWNQSGLQFNVPDKMTIARLIAHPKNSNVLLAGVTGNLGQYRGIWRTSDAGAHWKLVDGGAVYSIEFKPDNPAIVYASGYGNVRISNDTGATWTTITTAGLPTNASAGVTRTALAVCAAKPKTVYLMYARSSRFHSLYKSTDAGTTWTKKTDASSNTLLGTQADYAMAITVSPTNENRVFVGGLDLYMSTDGGVSWRAVPSDIHVDHHALAVGPNAAVYNGNDGGIYMSQDSGASFSDLSAGMQISQYYRLSCTQTDPTIVYAGAQDNGVHRTESGYWTHTLSGADGTACKVDNANDDVVFVQYQYGYLWRTQDGAHTWEFIQADSGYGNWITPLVFDPVNDQTVYIAYSTVKKSIDQGTTWSKISPALVGSDNMKALAVAPSNNKYIYTGSYLQFFRTSNAGTTWTNINAGLPIGDTDALTSILVHPQNPKWVWATFSGFVDGKKIYKSTDAGATWTNISGTLPNVPVNCAVFEKGTQNLVYVGTDVGVFYRDDTMDDWAPFMSGLPNVSVMDLDIQYATHTLRAATFGRGMWESPTALAKVPATVALVSPPNDSGGCESLVTVKWGAVAGAADYTVQVDTVKDFSSATPVFSRTGVAGTSTFLYPVELNATYYWRVAAENALGVGAWSPTWSFNSYPLTDVERAQAPSAFALDQNFPNPFGGSTTFQFSLARAGDAALTITNMLGQNVAMVCRGPRNAGTHRVAFDAARLPAGVYRYALTSGGVTQSRTMWIVR